ncbi:hypothetical protein RA280_15950 [Cupriavidus sp. CV2]|uniref:hypothetical protein n=1 Tax=Cupriavidus ulmosensis TaxID=3065913 RepID=UPI00296AE7DC|nr:hypothetical protein [Cupriavidus sp. CV2]MDW3683218.1 hypothetical protein [Cupriavidus sp. CV2]
MKVDDCKVSLGDGIVTVKRKGTQRLVIANVLGTVEADGVEVIYLDRLVHNHYENEMDGWMVAGAVTTLLSRPLGPFVSAEFSTHSI